MDRFWAKVDKSGPGGCWLWTAYRNHDGYGKIGLNGSSVNAHRMSWELAHGPIPKGLFVLHRCDVPRCVNPDHLFLGTQADNMRDMAEKGRRLGTHAIRGTECHRNKLSEMAVRVIHKISLDIDARSVGRLFGVKGATVRSIRKGVNWAWLTGGASRPTR